MKKSLFALSLFLFCLHGFSAGNEGYNIKIKIKGLHKDSVCYLANDYGDKQFIRDTAKADASGQLIFSKKEKLHGGIYFLVISKHRIFDFLIDNRSEERRVGKE